MTEVKSLNITAVTYRHRGWMWRDRATYEIFKAHMKLPLWIDRILTDAPQVNLFVVGKEDGLHNTTHVGNFRDGVRNIPERFEKYRARHSCRVHPHNGFVVLAERIRAKKPDANKTPRPQWRRSMTKPNGTDMLGGDWVVDHKFVREICLGTRPPAWADRLWVSTSAKTDTFVWVNSEAHGHAHGGELHTAKQAAGIKGYQTTGGFEPDSVVCNSSCHWQLAGVRKKTVRVPAPEVVKPSLPKPILTTWPLKARRDTERVPMGRVPSLNELICAPYGHDIYAQIAASLNTTRAEAKLRAFREAYTLPKKTGSKLTFDFSRVDFAELERSAAAHLAPKPPIGVKPRNLHDEERANALDEAMVRYLNEDLPFPIEWATEWNELRARLNKEQK